MPRSCRGCSAAHYGATFFLLAVAGESAVSPRAFLSQPQWGAPTPWGELEGAAAAAALLSSVRGQHWGWEKLPEGRG